MKTRCRYPVSLVTLIGLILARFPLSHAWRPCMTPAPQRPTHVQSLGERCARFHSIQSHE